MPTSDHYSDSIECYVQIINLTYTFRGLDAIRDLLTFCDEHATSGGFDAEVPTLNTPATPEGM
jgi:hypothetical protein